MRGQGSSLFTVLMILVVVGGFGALLYHNARSTRPIQSIIPTQVTPTAIENPWQEALRPGFGENTTPHPTIAIPQQQYQPSTLLPNTSPTTTPVPASELGSSALYTLAPVSVGVTPTPPPSTTPRPTGDAPVTVVQSQAQRATEAWQPPSLIPPLNRDPLGRDHYFFARPIDSSGTNFGLTYYMYGTDGTENLSAQRIHTGLDMTNPIGTTVRATGSGTVFFASTEENPYYQNSSSYGNVVVIEHDFSWQGLPLWTLYAHLQTALVNTGDYVQAGDPIALSGNSGRSSGPHLHFEVRMGENRYGSSYNPVLWVVPYVGRGVIAGRLVTERDTLIHGHTVTLRSWATNMVVGATQTYVFLDNVNDVNSDPNWQENFVFADLPEGRYEVVTSYEGQSVSRFVEVYEGRTTFVELKPVQPATSQPVETVTPTPEATDQ